MKCLSGEFNGFASIRSFIGRISLSEKRRITFTYRSTTSEDHRHWKENFIWFDIERYLIWNFALLRPHLPDFYTFEVDKGNKSSLFSLPLFHFLIVTSKCRSRKNFRRLASKLMSLKNFFLLHRATFSLRSAVNTHFMSWKRTSSHTTQAIAKLEMENRNVTFSIGGALAGGVMSIEMDFGWKRKFW